MKLFEVVLDKPSTVQDWCIWDNKTIYVKKPTTTALITAFNEERFKEKCESLYKGVRIISYKEIEA